MEQMDRFKMRAWHRELEIMRQVFSMSWRTKHVCASDANFMKMSIPMPKGQVWCWDFSEIDLLQCTGKRDRDNCLVYEGDRLINDDGHYKPDYLEVRWNEARCCFDFWCEKSKTAFNPECVNQFKIIGSKFTSRKGCGKNE